MKKKHVEHFQKELAKLNLELPESILFVCDLSMSLDEFEPNNVKYTKQYFSNYYLVDKETFNKWVQLFCKDFELDWYKRKKVFSLEQAYYIHSCLGRYGFRQEVPRNHKELADYIYKGMNWGKSKKYNELKLDFENRFPNESFKLNILPPKLVSEILTEEIESYKINSTVEEISFYERRVANMNQAIKKYGSLTDHQINIRRRWLRIWFSKP